MVTYAANAAAKPSLAATAAQISAEYPEIFTCPHEMMLFKADFKLLVRTFVTERNTQDSVFPEFKRIKASRIHEIVNRKMTKAYDAKAQAAGKPTLLVLAVKEAEGRDHASVNKEAQEEMTAMMEATNLSPKQKSEDMAKVVSKLFKRSAYSSNYSASKAPAPAPGPNVYNKKPMPPMFVKAMEIAYEYPGVCESAEDRKVICKDFEKLVRNAVDEEIGAWGLGSKDVEDTKEAILNRKTTKTYDEKAKANNRPTFLDHAKEQAKGMDFKSVMKQFMEAAQWNVEDNKLREAASKQLCWR